MHIEALLEKAEKFEVQKYKKTANLLVTHVPYSGAPRRHTLDEKMLILVPDPFSTNPSYYEFSFSDVDHVEKLQSLVTPEGQTVLMVRLWVRKGAVALHCTPFVVEDTKTRIPG